MREHYLRGIFAPVITPFTEEGEVDYQVFEELEAFILGNGVDGLLIGGTNGEFANLTIEERCALLRHARKARNDAKLVFNVTAMNMSDVSRLLECARATGTCAVTLTAPYFHRYDTKALYDYFSTVARAAQDLDVYIYNITGMTHNPIPAELLARLADDNRNIVGIKDSSMDFMTLLEYKAMVCREDFEIVTGNDAQVLYALLAGCDGGLIATASVFPSLCARLYSSYVSGRLDEAREIQNKIMAVRGLFRSVMPVMAHKEALALQGFAVSNARFPFRTLTVEEKDKVRNGLEKLGLENQFGGIYGN